MQLGNNDLSHQELRTLQNPDSDGDRRLYIGDQAGVEHDTFATQSICQTHLNQSNFSALNPRIRRVYRRGDGGRLNDTQGIGDLWDSPSTNGFYHLRMDLGQ